MVAVLEVSAEATSETFFLVPTWKCSSTIIGRVRSLNIAVVVSVELPQIESLSLDSDEIDCNYGVKYPGRRPLCTAAESNQCRTL